MLILQLVPHHKLLLILSKLLITELLLHLVLMEVLLSASGSGSTRTFTETFNYADYTFGTHTISRTATVSRCCRKQ